MILSVISAVLLVFGVALLFDLTPERISGDLIDLITPRDSLREQAQNLREGKKKHRLFTVVTNVHNAMSLAGKEQQFALACALSLALCVLGLVMAVAVDNLFMLPTFLGVGALAPFFYVSKFYTTYRVKEKEELETALSIISTSYIRSNDIISAVAENVRFIKPLLRDAFQTFVVEATTVTSDVSQAIANLRGRIDDAVFDEWCTTLQRCQEDSTHRDTLLSIVAKMADVRLVNGELNTIIASAKTEYWTMVLLVFLNIPLLYAAQKEWFDILVFSTPGKITCGVVSLVILITAVLMVRFTRPLEYKR